MSDVIEVPVLSDEAQILIDEAQFLQDFHIGAYNKCTTSRPSWFRKDVVGTGLIQ